MLINKVECYNELDENVTLALDTPMIARITAYDGGATDPCVIRWMDDENCDPIYDFEILEQHAAFAEARVRPSWMYGTSRSTLGTTIGASFVLADAELQATYEGALPIYYNDDGTKKEAVKPIASSIAP